ncbi:hypothetical protein TrRE_jg392, partial [Triparma retinervis]
AQLLSILSLEPALPLVTLDDDALRKTLLDRNITSRTTTPSFVRDFYSTSRIEHPSIRENHDNAKALLTYAISDLPADSSYTELSNLPLIPLADGSSLGTFSTLSAADPQHLSQLVSMGFTKFLSLHALRAFPNDLDSSIDWLFSHRHSASSTVSHGLDPYFICGGPAADILSPSPHTYVDEASLSGSPLLLKLFKSPRLQKSMNVISLDPTMLGDAIARAVPSLWAYICANPSSIPFVAEQYCIVPTTSSLVTNLSRGASVISASLLPQAVVEALPSLNVLTLLPSIFASTNIKIPPDLFNYIFEPTPESLIFAIDAALRRTSSKSSFESLDSSHKASLYEFLVALPPSTPYTPAALSILKTFPIFKVFDTEGGFKYSSVSASSTHVEFATLEGPPTSADTSVLSSLTTPGRNFVKITAGAETETLALLGVRIYGQTQYYTSLVFPNARGLKVAVMKDVMTQVLTNLPTLISSNPDFKHVVSETKCVPSNDCELQKPSKLFDPENYQLTVLLDDNAFPSDHFRNPDLLLPLKTLGLLTTLNFDSVLEVAKRIEQNPEDASAVERSKELLSFLDKNAASFFPELFPAPKQKKSFFGKISNALFEDGNAKQAEIEAQARRIEILRQTRWVPVLTAPPTPFVPWIDETVSIAKPKDCVCSDRMWLASSTSRLVDGEVRTPELKAVLGWNDELDMRNISMQLQAIAFNFSSLKSSYASKGAAEGLELNELCQAISSEIPRIYQILNQTTLPYDIEAVKSVLHSTPWLWMGQSFETPGHTAFSSPINATPYLHTVPPDLACFSNLLKTFGVRQKFTSSDFCQVSRRIYEQQQSDEPPLLPPGPLTDLAVQICQLLSDDVMHLSDIEVFAPDEGGALHPTSALVYDDAPWLSKNASAQSNKVFVHPKISPNVGDKLQIKSLRTTLLTNTSESLNFGDAHAESFGQAESLTRRLKNIIEMYPEGPSILSELIQNADDSKATTVKILVSKKSNPTSSLLGPKMDKWQGPSIYVYNDSTFTDRDFVNLSKIGQASKLDKLITTGRFGLGFNSVFHWTDVPSFVTGDHLVMFDPHEKYVPGSTSTSRGLKIKFSSSDLLDQFPDQFLPYCKFGCDMKSRFQGTLFRFPLRDHVTAVESEISKTAFGDRELQELLDTFQSTLPKFLLFLRNVKTVEVYLEDQDSAAPSLLYSASVASRQPLTKPQLSWSAVSDFITGPPSNPLSKQAFYTKLQGTPENSLPRTHHLVTITFSTSSTQTRGDEYIVCVGLGGGRCKDFACDSKHRHMKFLPWGGVAAQLSKVLRGNAFCFLPLPVETGMPVHVNGYFELSANRRDIWMGSDMTGEGRIRSEWNELLLTDVIAPLYADLLSISQTISDADTALSYYDIWPTTPDNNNNELYSSSIFQYVTSSLYKNSMNLKLFWCEGLKSYVSLDECVVVEESEDFDDREDQDLLTSVLLKSRLKVITLPKKILAMLKSNNLAFDQASPFFIRNFFKINDPEPSIDRTELLRLLKYCTKDLKQNGEDYKELIDLPLLPLLDGSFGRFLPSDSASRKYKVSEIEKTLLSRAQTFVVQTHSDVESVNSILSSNDIEVCTNVRKLEVADFCSLLPKIYPKQWENLTEVLWEAQSDPSHIEVEWIRTFWSYCVAGDVDKDGETLQIFQSTFQLLPTLSTDDSQVLTTLQQSLPILSPIDPSSPSTPPLSDDLLDALKSVQVKILDVEKFATGNRFSVVSALIASSFVNLPTAPGLLKALSNLFPADIEDGDLTRRVSLRFKNMSPGSRKCLRRFLREDLERSEGLSGPLQRILRSLPIFPVHERTSDSGLATSPPQYLDLLTTERHLAPPNVNPSLLDSSFVDLTHRQDVNLLRMVGVVEYDGKKFYTDVALPRMFDTAGLSNEVRDEASLKLLRDLPRLMEDGEGDDAFFSTVKQSKFVPNRLGEPVAPKDLYDPEISTLRQLLGDESFPADSFCTAPVLSSLRSLGMKNVLTPQGVIESASSISSTSSTMRARSLLRFVDENISNLLDTCDEVSDETKTEFVTKLREIPWLPAKTAFLEELLPAHPDQEQTFSSAENMRPKDDAWLCSSSKRLLDGYISNDALINCFGWDQDPDVEAVSTQLLALASSYKEEGFFTPSFRQTLASIIPQIYTLLDSFLRMAQEERDAGEDGGVSSKYQRITLVKNRFSNQDWLFVGDLFVSTNRVAFDAPSNARPHLFSVPPELECFEPMLKFFGVRAEFTGEDFVTVNRDLWASKEGSALTHGELDLVIGTSKLLFGLEKEEVQEASKKVGGIYLPSDSSVLQRIEDMVYDDAPWLSSSLAGKLRLRFVHPLVPGDVAMFLGARSLREVLLANQSGMQTIPCPSAESLNQLHKERTWEWKGRSEMKVERGVREDTRAILELLEVAEAAKVSKVKILVDYRKHDEESLLHPGLRSLQQSPSILVCFENVVVGVDELVRLSAPSGFYRSSVTKFGANGSPRFGSAICSAYQMTDCLQVLSGNQLHLFDPTGHFLFSGDTNSSNEATKRKKPKKKLQPVARRYGISSSDLFENFSDQYAPFILSPFGVAEAFAENAPQYFNGTIFRISMRSKPSTLSSRCYGVAEVEGISSMLASNIGEMFLFTSNITSIKVAKWENGNDNLVSVAKSRIRTSPSVRRNHMEKMTSNQDWKKSRFSTLFKKWDPVKDIMTMEVTTSMMNERIEGKEEEICDTYMCASVLAPVGLRELATSAEFTKLNIFPLLRVSAHVHRSVAGVDTSTKFRPKPGRVFVGGLDTGLETGLPINICAPLFLHEFNRRLMLDPRDDSDVRNVFPRIRILEEVEAGSRRMSTGSGGKGDRKTVSLWDWNRNVMHCTISTLMPYILKELRNPLEHLYSRDARNIYRYWPREERVKERYKAFITRSVYQELSKLDLYLTKSSGFCTIKDGVFESKDMELSERAGIFFRGMFSMFNVPAVVGRDIEVVGGVRLQTLSPAMARNFLKKGVRKEDLLRYLRKDPELAADLFLFCLGDCRKAEDTSADAHNGAVWREMAGLPLIPMVDESFGTIGGGGISTALGIGVGKKLAVIADREQQLLLPNMRDCFVEERFITLVGAEGWLEDAKFMRAMNITRFDCKVLAACVSNLLPKEWEGKDFVSWSDDNWGGVGGVQIDSVRGPNGLWLKLFWSQVRIYDTDIVGLFKRWPLVPLCNGELGSCGHVKFFLCLSRKAADMRLKRALALDYRGLSDKLKMEEKGGGAEEGLKEGGRGEGDGDDGWAGGAAEIDNSAVERLEASQEIQILSLYLKRIRSPAFELAYFSEDCVTELLLATPDKASFSKKILLTLSHCINYWPLHSSDSSARLTWDALSSGEKETFLNCLVFDEQRIRLNLLNSDLDKLQKLPLFETLGGTFVPLGNNSSGGGGTNDNYILGEGLTWEEVNMFLPDSSKFRFLKEKDIGELLKDLHVEALTEPKLLMNFVLPVFGEMPEVQKLSFLDRVKSRWSVLKEDEPFKLKMKGVEFVMRGGGGESYVKASECFDPTHSLLSTIYRDDSSKFPHVRHHGEAWLEILRELGLVDSVDKKAFLLCAGAVAEEGSYDKAVVLLKFLSDNFAEFFDPEFARSLSSVVFVPSNVYKSGGGAWERKLVTFREVLTPKDFNLGFTVMPMLREEVCPPQVMWSSLGIASPPTMEVVLGHLRNLCKDGGFLGKWDFPPAQPIAVFSSLFKFLEENWDKLSPRIKAALPDVQLVPVGTQLVKPKVLFFRLNMNLQPLLYELPRWCGGSADFFSLVGVRESPALSDYGACLEEMRRVAGDGVLTPNELQAVLKLDGLLGEKAGEGEVRGVILGVDDRSRMCGCEALIYNDAPWLTGRLERRLVRMVHPKMKKEVARSLKIRMLSESVVEILDDEFSLEGGGEGEDVTRKLRSTEFRDALRGLGGKGDLRKLEGVGVECVKDLRTRLVLKDSGGGRGGVDVTSRGGGEGGKSTTSFFDAARNRIFVAKEKLPRSLKMELIVATNLCDVCGIERAHVGTISAILASEVGEIREVTRAMKVDGGGQGIGGGEDEGWGAEGGMDVGGARGDVKLGGGKLGGGKLGKLGKTNYTDAVKAASEILASANINLKADVKGMMESTMSLRESMAADKRRVEALKSEVVGLAKELVRSEGDGIICPITRCPFDDPVIASDGFTYEREAIEQWLRGNNRSPQTNQMLPNRLLIPNKTLK